MAKKSVLAAVAGAMLMALLGLSSRPSVEAAPSPVHLDLEAKPARLISEYNLFLDNAKQIPNEGVLPYDLNTPLFSDYSSKHRFIYLPPGTAASYRENDVFDFPVGSIIVKTFGYLHDIRDPEKGERIIETRLLIHKEEGWVGLPYIWSEDMKDARLAVAGGRTEVEWTHYDGEQRTLNYIIPNMNQCKMCHENQGVQMPIGPKARHLNKPYDYDGHVENQLTKWIEEGYLEGAPADPADAPRVPNASDPHDGTLVTRARAYLDINCAHCHNPKGPAYTSGLDLDWNQQDYYRIGVNKTPVAAGRAGSSRYNIKPGDPDDSILVHRIETTDPGIMMPQLPRQLIHEEGVELIRDWITQLPALMEEAS